DIHRANRRKWGLWPHDPTKPVLSQADRKRAVDLFGRNGTRYWSGHRNLEDLVDEILPELGDPDLIGQLRALYDVAVGWSNRMTHASGLSTQSLRAEEPEEPHSTEDTLVVVTGPSRHQVADSLVLAGNSYLRVM